MKKWIFIIIFVLTVADALLTTLGVKKGVIEEANPLLQGLFEISPALSAAAIVLFVSALLWVMYKYQRRIKWINYGLGTLFAVKLYVLYLHFHWITLYVNS